MATRFSTRSIAGGKETSILVVVLETSEVYIIISLCTRNDTQVIHVDPTTGSLCYQGKFGHDLFSSEEEALNYVTDGSRWLCKSTTYARAILGYSALGSFGLLLVATRLTVTIPNLPGGGCVYTVAESQWIKIQLQNSQPQGKGELKNIQELAELDIDGKHFFCDTRDITRPFPSHMLFQNPDDEFVWNLWLSKPFKDIGLPAHCVILLQGFAECRSFGGSAQQVCTVALIARRSRLHPGTRYLARGLNACSSTGNEVECEQLVWVSWGTGQNVPFSTYVWRRGTIPIWWGAELKLTAAEAEIYVSAQDPYRGSLQYYQRLSQRYAARNLGSTIASQRKTPSVPIVCVNLLRSGEGKAEAILVEHFRESIKYVKSAGKLRNTLIQLINYDWHAIVKSSGEQQTIEGLWKILKAPTIIIGFSDGSYIPSLQQLREYKGAVISNDDIQGGFCLKSFQNGVIRFNCADSLDRTNAASYFGCLQVFVEQCKRLGISLDIDAIFGFPSLNKSADWGSFGGYSSLPPGWEERSDAVTGKVYYIDHNTRTTTWEHPCQDKPWKRFDMTFDQFKSSTTLAPINQLADLFLLAGDIHATLYTGSKAMHSQILNIFSEESGKFRQFSVALNVGITLQRRYKNVVVDSSRQKQLEMFLGIRLFKHLPSVSIHPLKVVSRPSGCLLKPIESMIPAADGGSSLLSFKRKDIIWVCPSDANVVEVFIYLGEPCHVCQLLLTVSHGADDSSYPATVDVRTGCSLDGLKLVLESACIPQCLNGTNISIPLTGRINPEDSAITGTSSRIHGQDNYLPFLYDFEELEGELNFLTRVVALTFYPSVSGITPLTLGEIEILGMPLPWINIFNNKGSGAKYLELIQKKTQQTNPFLSDSSTNDSTNPLFSDLHGSHFYDAPSNENALQGAVPGAISHGIDLLTGDLSFSQPLSKQEVPSTAESTGFRDEGQIDFFDSFIADPVFQVAPVLPFHSQEETHKELSGTQQYIKFVKSLSGSHKHQKIDFLEAIILEIERLRLNLSAAERDRALLSISIDPATIDPNRLVDESYMVKLCNYVTSLTILGQTAYEDQINASIGLQSEKNNVIDFWNVTKIGETCSGTMCEVRAEMQPSGKTSPSASCGSPLLLVCSQCGRKACKVCCAGKGAGLLLSNSYKETKKYNGLMSQSGSTHGQQSEKTSVSHSNLLDGVICKLCCSEVIIHALYVDYVRVLCSLRRGSRTDSAAYKALNEVLGQDGNSISDIWEGTKIEKKLLKQLFNSEESLAEFPYAGFLHMIETSAGSEPLLSLLAPLGIGRQNSYWHAPPGVSTLEFSIVLGSLSDVSGVALLVSSCGYSASDCPTVQIWASNKINREERSCMGKWDIQSLIASSPHLFGPEKSASEQDVPRHVKFLFRNPIRCQIIWIALTLPQPNLSSSILEKEYNLLSLDESAISLSDHQASESTAVRHDPCIHAKRFLVFGKSVRKVISSDASTQGPERMKMKAFLDRSPQLNRFRVPIEAERLTDDDLVLEQYLSPTVPVAGFRLDSFSVIKPRITHSPSSLDVDLWESSLTCLEDRHIMPAILHIQVSAVQEPKSLVTIGEYRLPEVKAGTALYFDFPRPIQAGRVIFRLLGDVTAFADDVSEQDDSEFRSLLASGLSLSNRIKLYYYADPYELGKIASLSTV